MCWGTPGTGEMRRIEHWNVSNAELSRRMSGFINFRKVAGNQGRAVGKTIAEGKGQPFVKVPVFWSARKCIELRVVSHSVHPSHRGPTVALLWRRSRL